MNTDPVLQMATSHAQIESGPVKDLEKGNVFI